MNERGSLDVYLIVHGQARRAPSFALLVDEEPNDDEINLFFHTWLWGKGNLQVKAGEDPNVSATVHTGIFPLPRHPRAGAGAGADAGASSSAPGREGEDVGPKLPAKGEESSRGSSVVPLGVRPIWQHRKDGGMPVGRLAPRSQVIHGAGARFSPCNAQLQLTHDAPGGLAAFVSFTRLWPGDAEEVVAGGAGGEGGEGGEGRRASNERPRAALAFHFIPEPSEGGAKALALIRGAIAAGVAKADAEAAGKAAAAAPGVLGAAAGAAAGAGGGGVKNDKAVLTAVAAEIEALAATSPEWPAAGAMAATLQRLTMLESGKAGTQAGVSEGEMKEGDDASPQDGGAAAAAAAADSSSSSSSSAAASCLTLAVGQTGDLETFHLHKFARVPHVAVYGDNYAPFAPALVVHHTSRAASPASLADPAGAGLCFAALAPVLPVSLVQQWAYADTPGGLAELEAAAEASQAVVALKRQHEEEQEQKLARAMGGGGNGGAGGGGDGDADDPVAMIRKHQEQQAAQVAQCTGLDLATAQRFVEQCGGAEEAVEYFLAGGAVQQQAEGEAGEGRSAGSRQAANSGGGGGSGASPNANGGPGSAVAEVAQLQAQEAQQVADITGLALPEALALVERCGGAQDAIAAHFS